MSISNACKLLLLSIIVLFFCKPVSQGQNKSKGDQAKLLVKGNDVHKTNAHDQYQITLTEEQLKQIKLNPNKHSLKFSFIIREDFLKLQFAKSTKPKVFTFSCIATQGKKITKSNFTITINNQSEIASKLKRELGPIIIPLTDWTNPVVIVTLTPTDNTSWDLDAAATPEQFTWV